GDLKRLLPKRPDLRVIVTSATIDVERYSEFFASNDKPAPVLLVEGRTFPVEVRYRPPEATEDGDGEPDPMRNLVAAVEDVCREGRGDALVFVPTERDIREAAKFLRS